MKRYFKSLTPITSSNPDSSEQAPPKVRKETGNSSKKRCGELDLDNPPADPGLRPPISSYHPNVRDQVRRTYLLRGPCQPQLEIHDFPQTLFGKMLRRFCKSWFDEFPTWLEYNVKRDGAYCLYCYLFKPDNGDKSGGDTFVGKKFDDWKNKAKLYEHIGKHNSSHHTAWKMGEDLLNQKQHIAIVVQQHTDQDRSDYKTRLSASIGVIRLLLHQGLPFRGHDESEDSDNQGNFLEILKWLCDYNEGIKAVTLKNAPENLKLTSPDIQKDIVSAISTEIIIAITSEIGDWLFSILVDESRDMSLKEQMAIVLRYVVDGRVIERFVGIEHVGSTKAIALKSVIDEFFSRNGLSISRLRGQGYDGARNMRGEFNGLKTLILNDNECAFYVHCFAHQLQLALVAVAKKHKDISYFFALVSNVVNVVGGSAIRLELLREKHADVLLEALSNNELTSGKGLNQETNLQRSCDTRWSSHFNTITSLIKLFESVIYVLEIVREDGSSGQKKFEAKVLLNYTQTFDFIFCLHLMKKVLGITNDLSQALQRKDQDIVNAMNLISICKTRLQNMRETGWNILLTQVSSSCGKYQIKCLEMGDMYQAGERPSRKAEVITNLHHYRVGLFYSVIDMQMQELNNRFTEKTTQLLLCVACLNPSDAFSSFDKEKLIQLTAFYPRDFCELQLEVLAEQLENYIIDMRSNVKFANLKGITDLALKMFETKKDKTYALVYLLVTLALLLPVATASVERAFSAMNIVKNRLRNRMGDEFMNGCLTAYIEKKIFDSVDDEDIMKRFQEMKPRQGRF